MGIALRDPVLLVEDTRSLSMVYETLLKKQGYGVSPAFNFAEAADAYRSQHNQLVLLDLMLPDGDGIDLLREIRQRDPRAKVVVITANGSINRAVEAMREGAFDFLVKPFDDRRLMTAVAHAAAALTSTETAAPAEPTPDGDGSFEGFIGSSPPMRRVYEMLRSIGRSSATVFITGESGTGKEMAAQAIHSESKRQDGPFVPLNCGAIPKDLLESEVFGHLRGSFTGAIADKQGAAASADGGTLFLDEICEMDLALQTKLLRFLQTSMIQPVGATRAHKVEVRIVCATNRDPMTEVRAGRFREDLFYRLHVVPIELPPLRERGDDVIQIARALLEQYAAEEKRRFRALAPETEELLAGHHWPGNVRELQNVLRHSIVLNDGEVLEPWMLPPEIARQRTVHPRPPAGQAEPAPAGGAGDPVESLVGTPLAEVERRLIEATIASCGGSVPRAARLLDLSASTIYRKRDAWKTRGRSRR